MKIKWYENMGLSGVYGVHLQNWHQKTVKVNSTLGINSSIEF